MSGADQFAANLQARLRALAVAAGERLDPTPGRILELAPGQAVAFDDCCNGQVWVRLANMFPAEASNAQRRPGLDACAVSHFIAQVELGAVRCAATIREKGNRVIVPTPAEITDDGVRGTSDMAALLEVMACWGHVRTLTSWTPQGPEGGCHGGYWTFTMRVDNCITCDAQEVG